MGEILIEKTKKLFGYDIKDLKYGSEKLVIWKCEHCGIEVEKKYRYAKKNKLCLKCSNKINANSNKERKLERLREWHKTNTHPLKGTTRPDHVKKALIDSHLGVPMLEEVKRKLSLKNSGKGNPFYGKKHTKESIEKMRKIQKEIVRKGKDSNFYGKCYHGKGNWYYKDSIKIWMRSSWEIKFAEYLDKKNIKWKYESKTFPIKYNNKDGTYTPDFYLNDNDSYIEIKGFWRDDALEKYTAFNKQYENIKIEIYDINKLKELEIL